MNPKEFQKLLSEAVRPLKDIVEVVKRKVDSQQVFASSAADNIRLMKEQQSIMNEKLDHIDETLEDHTRRLEALSGDMEQVLSEVKASHDEIGLWHQRDKREIDEIKRHVGIPLISDTP